MKNVILPAVMLCALLIGCQDGGKNLGDIKPDTGPKEIALTDRECLKAGGGIYLHTGCEPTGLKCVTKSGEHVCIDTKEGY